MSGQEAGQPRQQQQSDVDGASSKGRTTLGRVSFGTSRALPDHIVARRTGNVLIKHTILKSDHFPGIHVMKRDYPSDSTSYRNVYVGAQDVRTRSFYPSSKVPLTSDRYLGV